MQIEETWYLGNDLNTSRYSFVAPNFCYVIPACRHKILEIWKVRNIHKSKLEKSLRWRGIAQTISITFSHAVIMSLKRKDDFTFSKHRAHFFWKSKTNQEQYGLVYWLKLVTTNLGWNLLSPKWKGDEINGYKKVGHASSATLSQRLS